MSESFLSRLVILLALFFFILLAIGIFTHVFLLFHISLVIIVALFIIVHLHKLFEYFFRVHTHLFCY